MSERFFITGATGCIGGWVVKLLVEAGHKVYALVRGGSLEKLRLIMSEETLAGVHIIQGDLLDYALLEQSLTENHIQRLIHLAAMQMPFCRADPRLGAKVNVEGTVNIFEAAKKAGISHLAYSSSTAVYGDAADYPNGCFGDDSPLLPHSHYGLYKQANEWSAKVYCEESGITSIGIRPFVVYGPLRDQGMSSTPTAAMKAAAKGEGYHISYGGSFGFQYVSDTADAFIRAACCNAKGASVYNLGGETVHMCEVVGAIETVCPEVQGKITYASQPLPFPRHNGGQELAQVIGPVCSTSLLEGIRSSIQIFQNN